MFIDKLSETSFDLNDDDDRLKNVELVVWK